MRIPAHESEVEVDGDFDAMDITIESTIHAFNVLSKGLYSDPFRAIVRELSCNAWDAHIEAGTTDKPFDLYLPNTLAPVFKIRDYGTGLSPEAMEKVYRKVFCSTKQNSDLLTGCFGLGSKSPFAYTKKLVVISYQDGVRYHYNVIISERGTPQVVKLGTSPTEEPNGLEVSFSVDENDFWDFERAARISLRPFIVAPQVFGRTHFTPDSYPEDPVIVGKGWRLYRKLERGSICSMGNVEYPIDPSRSGFSPVAKKVLGLPMIIEFPIGSFEVTPSRESIQWTDFSVKNVNDRLEQIYDELVEHVSVEVNSCTSLWEARLATNRLLSKTGLSRFGLNAKWRDKLVTPKVEVKHDGLTITKITAVESRRSTAALSASVLHTPTVRAEEGTTFFFDDFKSTFYRVGNHVRENLKEGQSVYVISARTQRALKHFCAEVGISRKDLVPASSIPKKERAARESSGGTYVRGPRTARDRAKVFEFRVGNHGVHTSADAWAPIEVELDAPGINYYLPISRWTPDVYDEWWASISGLHYKLRDIAKLGIEVPKIYGIKTSALGKFQGLPNWEVFTGKILSAAVLEWWDANLEFRVRYSAHEHLDYSTQSDIRRLKRNVDMLKSYGLLEDSPLSKDVEKLSTMCMVEREDERFQAFNNVAHLVKSYGSIILTPPTTDPKDLLKSVHARYPLLEVLFSRYLENDIKDGVVEYINLIDARNASKTNTESDNG